MKRHVIAGFVPVLAALLTLAACSHGPSKEEKEAQAQAQANAQTQQNMAQQSQAEAGTAATASSNSEGLLGEQNTSTGTAEVQRQKKVISTVIIKDKIPTVRETTVRADINRMNASQFAAIGFPSEVSQSIVQYRDSNGPFHSVKDLAYVDGVSNSMLTKFDGALGVGTPGATSSAGISGDSELPAPSDSGQ